MQSVQLQKDKLDIIEWVRQLEDSVIIDHIKSLMASKDNDSYHLTPEQITEVRERSEKHMSGEDKGFTWDDVKERARKKLDEKKS